jgi:hypothetical protein
VHATASLLLPLLVRGLSAAKRSRASPPNRRAIDLEIPFAAIASVWRYNCRAARVRTAPPRASSPRTALSAATNASIAPTDRRGLRVR